MQMGWWLGMVRYLIQALLFSASERYKMFNSWSNFTDSWIKYLFLFPFIIHLQSEHTEMISNRKTSKA